MEHFAQLVGTILLYAVAGILVVYVAVRVGASAWFRSKKEYYQNLMKHQKEPHE